MMDQHQVNTNTKCSLAVEEYIPEEAIFKRPKMLIAVWLKTLALIFVWIGMGMCQSIPAATLPDLRARLKISIEEAGRGIAVSGFGGMIGAPLGCLADRFHKQRHVILTILVVISGAVFAVKPVCGKLWIFIGSYFIEGMTWCCVNAVGNPMMVEIWGQKSGAPLQALHLGYPIGTMVGPLISYYFVSNMNNHTETRMTWNVTTQSGEAINRVDYIEDTSRIEIVYGFVGCYCVMIGIVILAFHFAPVVSISEETATQIDKRETLSWKEVFSPSTWAQGDSKFGISILILVMVFYYLKVVTGRAFYMFGATYAVESHLAFTTKEGTLFTAASNLGSTIGRASGIILAGFIPTEILIFVLVYGQCISSIFVLVWGTQNKTEYVVFSALFRSFSAPVWPCGYAWTDRYIILFAFVVGAVDLIANLATAVMSYSVALLYKNSQKESIFYVSVTGAILQSLLIIIMTIYARKHGNRFTNPN